MACLTCSPAAPSPPAQPNENYIKFEKWIDPILDEMLEEQKAHGINWTPSKVGWGTWCMATFEGSCSAACV